TSSRVIGWSQPETPEVCDSRWRTLIPALPRAANSGQYLATVASRSSLPRSTSTSAASAVIVLVVEKTLVTVRETFASYGSSIGQRALSKHAVAPLALGPTWTVLRRCRLPTGPRWRKPHQLRPLRPRRQVCSGSCAGWLPVPVRQHQ